MGKLVLITGGAGFIGSHVTDELLQAGYRVRILDNLLAQVHGPGQHPPDYLDHEAELIIGDIRDPEIVRKALTGVDVLYHFAALVGVGQSMYQIRDYVDVNDGGTGTLLQEAIRFPLEKIIVASSMSVYGEGLYRTAEGKEVHQARRKETDFRSGKWDIEDDEGIPLVPVPTPEWKQPELASVYALSKYVQEQMTFLTGKAYSIPTVALRFFNVYGTRQSLSNPYTGVLAIFASRFLNNRPPIIFEDGNQKRDFIHVRDVATACRLAMETESVSAQPINIGSGNSYSIREIAEQLGRATGRRDIAPEVSGKYRVGDIRHCFSDISRARDLLGFTPEVSLSDGLTELADWLSTQQAVDRFDEAKEELSNRGLTL
ncbi:MAG: NAD-dependent epimerase/dehydratase family protein [Desulfovibrionales bacterium]